MGKKLTKEIFIERSIEKHGSIFDYSKVIFKNTKTKVEIICNDHGSFYQPPGNHMMGQQCPSCSGRPKITTKTLR
jgi:Zn finger protein HypA/HybF involved in hydrogenase expression